MLLKGEIIKAIILAGGFGTRLRPLTYTRPKHMLPILGKPLLEYIVKYVKSYGVKEIFLSISAGKEFDIIEEYFKKDEAIKIIREPERMGGAGAIKYAIEKSGIKGNFVLILGDNLTNINLEEMIRLHEKEKPIVTVGLVRKENPWEYGVAVLEGSKIVKFVEKPKEFPPPSNLVATGVYVMNSEIVKFIPEEFLDSTGMLFPLLLKNGGKICGYESINCFWIDVGRRRSYLDALRVLLKGKRFANFYENVKIHGPVYIEDNVKIGKNSKLWTPCQIGENVKIGEDCEINSSIIFSNVKIGNNVKIKDAIIDEGCEIENGCVIKECIIGKNCKISSNKKIFENINSDSVI